MLFTQLDHANGCHPRLVPGCPRRLCCLLRLVYVVSAGQVGERPARQRGRYLRQAAEAIRTRVDEIAALESLEMGKPITQARQFDVEAAISIFEYFGSLVEVLPSQARDYGPVFDVTSTTPSPTSTTKRPTPT